MDHIEIHSRPTILHAPEFFAHPHRVPIFLKKEEKHCNSENTEYFRKVQRQIYCKMVTVSLKPFSSKKYVIEVYTQLFKDFKPMLFC